MDCKYNHFLLKFKEKGYTNNIWINRYLKFIDRFSLNESIKFQTENHHILPSSIFPEFKNLKNNEWNRSILSVRSHIVAHYLLAKAIGGKMWAPLYFYKNKYNFNSKQLSEIILNNKKNLSDINKGMISVYDISEGNKYKKVTKEEFLSNKNYVGVNKGRKDVGEKISKSLNMIDVNGKTKAKNRGKIGIENPMFGMNGDKNPFYGKKHTQITKDKLSSNRKGKSMNNDTKLKISQSLKKPKINKDNYTKYYYIIYLNDVEIFRNIDKRNIQIYLKENMYPSIWTLQKKDHLNFKFRKFLKTNVN